MALSISVNGFQTLSYKLADNKILELHPGITNLPDGPDADYVLQHPMTEILESTGKISIDNAVTKTTKDKVFEVVDTSAGDAMPVGDLVQGKTVYRGDTIKDPEKTAAVVAKKTRAKAS